VREAWSWLRCDKQQGVRCVQKCVMAAVQRVTRAGRRAIGFMVEAARRATVSGASDVASDGASDDSGSWCGVWQRVHGSVVAAGRRVMWCVAEGVQRATRRAAAAGRRRERVRCWRSDSTDGCNGVWETELAAPHAVQRPRSFTCASDSIFSSSSVQGSRLMPGSLRMEPFAHQRATPPPPPSSPPPPLPPQFASHVIQPAGATLFAGAGGVEGARIQRVRHGGPPRLELGVGDLLHNLAQGRILLVSPPTARRGAHPQRAPPRGGGGGGGIGDSARGRGNGNGATRTRDETALKAAAGRCVHDDRARSQPEVRGPRGATGCCPSTRQLPARNRQQAREAPRGWFRRLPDGRKGHRAEMEA
jgi:hypothetical protein